MRDAVVRDAFSAVEGTVNDAAAPEAIRFQKPLHRAVIRVRVGAQIADLRGAEVKAGLRHATRFPVGGETVDRAVGLIEMPRAVFDDAVALVLAEKEGECADDLAIFKHHIAAAACDIIGDDAAVWVLVAPLRGIAVCAHVALCGGEDVQHRVDVLQGGFANFHFSPYAARTSR